MTLVHFNYTDSYNKASRGSLAFTPHRRHAANETEILPKPVTVPLLNGEVTVDLQPNPSTWVWIITEYFEQHAESFYTTIPDSDGVIEAVDLIRINPSTIPAPYNAVEPVWWAEMRQYKQTVTETLLKAGEALESSESSLEESAQNRDESRQSAANAKAYSEQSRDSAYESKEYRDQSEAAAVEAERQADRAASGPESAAGRAESARDAAEGYRDETLEYRNSAQSSANDARDDAQTASQHNSDAYNSARDADTAQETAETYRDEAKQYRDDILEEPESLEDRVKNYHDNTQTYMENSQGYRDETRQYHSESKDYRDESESFAEDAENYVDTAKSQVNEILGDFTSANNHGEWVEIELSGDYEHNSDTPLQVRKLSTGHKELYGRLSGSPKDQESKIGVLPEGYRPESLTRSVGFTNNPVVFSLSTGGDLIIRSADADAGSFYIHTIFV